jgi:hypothetical protein
MDRTAVSQCQEKDLPIMVFNYGKPGNIERAVLGHKVGTIICSERWLKHAQSRSSVTEAKRA